MKSIRFCRVEEKEYEEGGAGLGGELVVGVLVVVHARTQEGTRFVRPHLVLRKPLFRGVKASGDLGSLDVLRVRSPSLAQLVPVFRYLE